jgi:glycerate 2-kinase
MKNVAHAIFRETLAALDIRDALDRKLARAGAVIQTGGNEIDLRSYREIVAIAFGKASFAMAEALSGILSPDFECAGILVGLAKPPRELAGWRSFVAAHPVPDEQSFAAARAILDRLAKCDSRSLIFFLLSGGGSSLVEAPIDSRATLADFRQLHNALVKCGAPIEEINIVRRHISATKGGRLAAAAPESMKITFAISDVPPGMEAALASGPTLPDPTTLADAERVIRKNSLEAKLPQSIRSAFASGVLPESPKPGDAAFRLAHFSLILGTHDLTHAAHHSSESHGYACVCDTETDNWPLDRAADFLLAMVEQQKKEWPGHRVAVIAGGEVSSPVTGDGMGGRNSAFALACAPKIAGKKIAVLSVGTDGIDGNSPAAGAMADGETMARAQAAGIDPADFLRRSDAYHFFDRLGDAIVTGPTGMNVRDLRIFLAEPD